MIKFEELLIKWNNGIRRGAQTNFANKIGVNANTVSQWIKFERPPDIDLRQRVAQKLGITIDELLDSFLESRGISSDGKARQRIAKSLGVPVDKLVEATNPPLALPKGVTMGQPEYSRGTNSHEVPWVNETVHLEVDLSKEAVMKLFNLCKEEKRGLSAKLEVILEDWFRSKEKAFPPGELTGEEWVHRSPPHMMTQDPKRPPAPNRPEFSKPIVPKSKKPLT